jgi:plastocyanin
VARARVEHGSRDPAVSIADFHFTAATLTIHAGDTVTWSNQGPSPHTATASDGSFNTGVLNKGQTASHTFTKPGTFTYVCQIHPFMHGTVVVLAASSNPSSGPSPGTTTASAAGHGSPGTTASASQGHATTPAAGRPTLPVTGANLIQVLVAGLLLCTGGTALRLVVSRRWPPR